MHRPCFPWVSKSRLKVIFTILKNSSILIKKYHIYEYQIPHFYFNFVEHRLDAWSLLPLVGAAIMPFITVLDDDDDEGDDDEDDFDDDDDDE